MTVFIHMIEHENFYFSIIFKHQILTIRSIFRTQKVKTLKRSEMYAMSNLLAIGGDLVGFFLDIDEHRRTHCIFYISFILRVEHSPIEIKLCDTIQGKNNSHYFEWMWQLMCHKKPRQSSKLSVCFWWVYANYFHREWGHLKFKKVVSSIAQMIWITLFVKWNWRLKIVYCREFVPKLYPHFCIRKHTCNNFIQWKFTHQSQ